MEYRSILEMMRRVVFTVLTQHQGVKERRSKSIRSNSRPGKLPTSRITTREPTHKQNYDQGAGWLAGRLAGGITTRKPFLALGWLAGWAAGWLAGWLRPKERGQDRPREAQRVGAWIEQTCHALGWRHKQICDQGCSPQISLRNQRGSPADYQTEIHFKPRASPQAAREVPHKHNYVRPTYKQNYDQEAYPQAELPPGSWLAGWLVELRPGSLWLAGWLRPREAQREAAQRGTESRSGDGTSLPFVWLEAPTSRFTTREAPHRFLYGTPEETPRGLLRTGFQNRIPLQTQCLPTSRTVYVCMLCMYDQEAPHKQNYDRGGRITTREVELQPELFL